MMRQHLAILCDNKPGVLTHVAGLISRRDINIECINAGYTEEADVTRINIVVSVENRWELDQAVNQLAKLIDVIKVVNLDDAPFISYELAMIKVQSPTPQTREELTNIAQLFNAKIVDVQRRSLVLRLTGREDHIEALLEMLKDGEMLSSDCEEKLEAAGFRKSTIKKAKKNAGVISRKKGFLWYWSLPMGDIPRE